MYPQRVVSQALRLGLLVTLVVLALSACGGEKQQEFKPQPLPENYSGPCVWYLRDCVDIFETSSVVESSVVGGSGEGWIAFMKDNKQRLFVLEDVKGKTVTMGFTIPATKFDEQAPEAQKVIDSVEWTGS